MEEQIKVPEKQQNQNATSKGLDFLISGILALVFLLTPVFFTGTTAQGIGFEKMMLFYCLVLIGTVSWVGKGALLGELKLKRTPLDIPIIAVFSAFVLSTIFSVDAGDSVLGSYGSSVKGLVSLFAFILFYYLMVNNINAKRIKLMFWSFVVSSSALVIFTLLQVVNISFLPFDIPRLAVYNLLGSNASSLAMYFLMSISLFVVAISQVDRINKKLSSGALIAVRSVLGAVFLASMVILAMLNNFTFWPIGWVLAIIGMVIVLMFFMAKIIKTTNLILPFASFFVLIIFLVMGTVSFAKLNLPAEVSLSRSASWGIAKNAIAENPVFGSGPSTFYYNFSKFKDDNFNLSQLWNIRFDSATGIVYELLATVGILGTLAVIILALVSISTSFISLLKSKDEELSSILLGLFSAMIPAVLFSLFFPQSGAVILTFVLLTILTVVTAEHLHNDNKNTMTLSFRSSANFALALAAVFLVVSASVVVMFTMGLKMFWADVYAANSAKANNLDEKIELMNQAINLAPYRDPYYLTIANNYMSKANQNAIGDRDQASVSTNLALAIKMGKAAADNSPNTATNNEALALIYENASFYTRGALTHAENLYKKNIELEPNNPIPHLRMALVNMARSNAETDDTEKKYFIEEAIKKYDEAIAIKGDLAAAYYGKAVASEKVGKINDAIENLKQAVMHAGDNLDYRFELGRLYFNRGIAQSGLDQSATKEIAEGGFEDNGKDSSELSVTPGVNTGSVRVKEDLLYAEQLFASIIDPKVDPNNANAIYSLAVLYKKMDNTDMARVMVDKLLGVLRDVKTAEAVKQQFADLYN